MRYAPKSSPSAGLSALFLLSVALLSVPTAGRGQQDPRRLLLRCDFNTLEEPTLGTFTTPCSDNSGGEDATLHGDITTEPGRVPLDGSANTALVLDGTGDYLSLSGMPNLKDLPAVTVEAWVKVATPSTNIFRVQQPVSLGSNKFQVHDADGGSGWNTLLTHSPPPANDWYHVAGVFDQREMRIYVNGRLSDIRLLDFESVTAFGDYTDWAIGARLTGGVADQEFTGSIDEVAVYEGAVDAGILYRHAQDRQGLSRINIKTQLNDPAAGDGVTDDTAAFVTAFSNVAVGGEIYLPSGVYIVSNTLNVPSGIMLRGSGDSILRAAPGVAVSPFLRGDDISDTTIRDLQIWGHSFESPNPIGRSGIYLTATERVHVDRVRISNLGKDPQLYGGIQIWIDDREGQPNDEGSSFHNVIENCRLDDWDHLASFGIRIETRFKDLHITPSDSATVRENVLKNNHFEGFWQSIEVAGPQTHSNLVRGNQARSPLIVGIEADKGARGNIYLDNYIRLGRYHQASTTSGMRDQGYRQCVAGQIVNELNSKDNVFLRNTIVDITDRKIAAGILIARAENTVFQKNMVRDIRAYDPAKSAMAVLRTGLVLNPTISENLFPPDVNETYWIGPDHTCPPAP